MYQWLSLVPPHPPPQSVTSLTPHYVSARLGRSLGHNLDISHLNNAVVICQTPSICLPSPRLQEEQSEAEV